MKKRSVIPFLLLVALCAINIRVHAQGFGTEQFPCYTCDSPTDPCTICNDPNNPPLNLNPPAPPPDTNAPKPPPAQPTGPGGCTVNPCACNPASCGISPGPSGCNGAPCTCNPASCAPYNGTTPNPPAPKATVTVSPTLSSAGSTVEYVTATAPTGSIFSWGSLGINFAINPQNNTLNAAPGGGTSANPWNVNSWVAGNGTTYSQVQVINSNAPGVIAFTIICQLTPNGSPVPSTQSINVMYTLSTNSCIITEN